MLKQLSSWWNGSSMFTSHDAVRTEPYENGSHFTGDVSAWNTHLSHPDSDAEWNADTLKARARDVVRNDPFAVNARNVRRDNIIGPRVRMSLRPDAEALGIDVRNKSSRKALRKWSRKVEREFDLYSHGFRSNVDARRVSNLSMIMQSVVATEFVDGEAFGIIQFITKDRLDYGTCVQLISGDRVKTPPGQNDDMNLRRGIVRDAFGAPKAAWVRRTHTDETQMGTGNPESYRRIPFNRRNGRPVMLHVYDTDVPEMTRGVSSLSTVLGRMKMLKEFNSNELKRAILHATYAAVIKSEINYDQIMNVIGAYDMDTLKASYGDNFISAMNLENMASKSEYYRTAGITLNGTKIPHLMPNEDLEIKSAGGGTSVFADFEGAFLRQFAAGLGVDFASLSKNYSQLPYAAARMALADVWRGYMVKRERIVHQFGRQLVAAWLEEAFLIGKIGLPPGVTDFYGNWQALCRCEFLMEGKPFIDPMKERSGQKLARELGTETLRDISSQSGNDYEDQLEQIADENDLKDDLGIVDADTNPELAFSASKGTSTPGSAPRKPPSNSVG